MAAPSIDSQDQQEESDISSTDINGQASEPDELESDDDILFEFEASTLTVVDRRTILTALHHQCAKCVDNRSVGVILANADGMSPLAREHGEPMAQRVREETYLRLINTIVGVTDAGLIDDDSLLMLLQDHDADAAARAMTNARAAAGQVQLNGRTFAVSFSAAVTAIRQDDLPEAIVGRLSRALQRVLLGGGENIERV